MTLWCLDKHIHVYNCVSLLLLRCGFGLEKYALDAKTEMWNELSL